MDAPSQQKKPRRNKNRKQQPKNKAGQPTDEPTPPAKRDNVLVAGIGGIIIPTYRPNPAAVAAVGAEVTQVVNRAWKLSGLGAKEIRELAETLAGHPTATIEAAQRLERFSCLLAIADGMLPGNKENWKVWALARHTWLKAEQPRMMFRLIIRDLNSLGMAEPANDMSRQRDSVIATLASIAELEFHEPTTEDGALSLKELKHDVFMAERHLVSRLLAKKEAHAGGNDGVEWSIPMPLSKLALALDNITTEQAKSILARYGLERFNKSRQWWRVRLDSMDANMRKKIESIPRALPRTHPK